jgi:hypothetical protein
MGPVAQRQRPTLKANKPNAPDQAFQPVKVRGVGAGVSPIAASGYRAFTVNPAGGRPLPPSTVVTSTAGIQAN